MRDFPNQYGSHRRVAPTSMSPYLTIEALKVQYGEHTAIANLSFSAERGEFLTLLGPSGCGKTTTLRSIAGFVTPVQGRILVDGQDITALPPHRRNIGVVFQSYALFPHLTVHDNVAFGLRMRQVAKAGALSPRARRRARNGGACKARRAVSGAAFRRPATARRDCARACDRAIHPFAR